MSFNGSGVYELTTGIPVVINSTISSTVYNTAMTDIETAMNLLWLHDGTADATGNIAMNGNRVVLDADEDTHISAQTDGTIVFTAGGVNVLEISSGGFRTTNALYGIGPPSELTIDSSGDIDAIRSYHTVDTLSDASTDDLDTIATSGMTAQIPGFMVIGPENGARTVVVKDGAGNLNLRHSNDFTMSDANDRMVLLSMGSLWYEVSRSSNG